MPNHRLRIYLGPEENPSPAENQLPEESLRTVNVPFGEIVSVLAEALCEQRQWICDFAEDPVAISEDLYEVLLAYQRLRRPTA